MRARADHTQEQSFEEEGEENKLPEPIKEEPLQSDHLNRIIPPQFGQFQNYPKCVDAKYDPREPLNIDTKLCDGKYLFS